MKKFIIIAIALVVVAGGIYLYKNKSANSGEGITQSISNAISGSSSSSVLEYVPADTVLFGGSLNPLSYEQTMELSRNMGFDLTSIAAMADTSDMQAGPDTPDAGKLLLGLYKQYMASFNGDLPKEFGFTNDMDMAIYTVGALPVLRIALDDTNNFANIVSKINTDNNMSPTQGTVDGVNYSLYNFDQTPEAPQLVLSIHNKQAVITVNTLLADEKDLALTLGATKPSESIASSKTLNKLISKHNYKDFSLFFVDNLAIVKGLTNPSANSFGGMVQELAATYGNPNALQDMQSAECSAEYTALAANWPTLSAGYTEFSDKSASYRMTLEGSNSDLLSSLQKLRGHISPTLNDSNFMMSMGMGFNMDELAPVVTDIWKRFTKDPYQCAPLAAMQAEMKQNNPMMQLGMMSGMLAGIKGLGVAIIDMDIKGLEQAKSNPMAAADAINLFVTLSADDPMALIQTLATFQPQLGQLDLKDGGEAVNLPLPVPVEVKAALRGHDLVVSFGEKANGLVSSMKSNTGLDLNGLMSINMDMGRYFGMLQEVISMEAASADNSADAAQAKKVFEMFKDVKGQISETIDFSDRGLELNVDMQIND